MSVLPQPLHLPLSQVLRLESSSLVSPAEGGLMSCVWSLLVFCLPPKAGKGSSLESCVLKS